MICKGNVCQFYWRSTAQLLWTAQNAFTQIIMQWRCHCFQSGTILCCAINPSAWSDERCSSWRKHHLSWSDEHWSCCTLSLIWLYLDNIGRKCNWAALYVFKKELALLWCGRQFLQIIASFFSLLSKFGFSFCSPQFHRRLYGSLERGNEIWNECYCYHHVAEVCSFEIVYDITLIYQQTVCFFTADCWIRAARCEWTTRQLWLQG